MSLPEAVIELGPKEFTARLSFVVISQVKTLGDLAFCSSFPLSHLHRKEETASMRMLKVDNIRQQQLGFSLDMYGVSLDEYVFND